MYFACIVKSAGPGQVARIILINMRKIIVLFSLVCIVLSSDAQTAGKEPVALTNVSHHAGMSVVELVDPYLSILNYNGLGLRFEHTETRYFKPANPKFIAYSRLTGLGAAVKNPQATAGITYVGGNAAWGVLYEYRDISNLIFHAGGNMDVDFAYKMNSRNVNNPVNIDLATNLNAMLGIRYNYATKKRILKLKANLEFPLIGYMFVPYPGLTYYEMYSSGAYGEAIHFSSLHNKQGLKEEISIDVPFKKSTCSFGVRMHQLKYQAGDQPYRFNEFSIFVGINYDILRFSGRKVKIPEHYVSPGN